MRMGTDVAVIRIPTRLVVPGSRSAAADYGCGKSTGRPGSPSLCGPTAGSTHYERGTATRHGPGVGCSKLPGSAPGFVLGRQGAHRVSRERHSGRDGYLRSRGRLDGSDPGRSDDVLERGIDSLLACGEGESRRTVQVVSGNTLLGTAQH